MRIRSHKRSPSASPGASERGGAPRWHASAGSRARRSATLGALALALVAGARLAGCASSPGVLFERAGAANLVWPPPPDTPRVAYVGSLVSDRDLKPSRTLGQRVGDTLFGREEARGMVNPSAVCTDGAGERGRVFVADPGRSGVHVFDLESRRYELWTLPDGAGRMAFPVAIAIDPSGRVIVSDSGRGELLAFASDGVYLGPLAGDLLERPVGLAIDRDGRMLVVDTGAHEVVVLSPDAGEITRFGGRGSAPGLFNFPTHIALDDEGRIAISDTLNFRVQVFAPDFTLLRTIGRQGDMPGYFSHPKGLGVDGRGVLFVVDANFEALQLFDPEGRLLMTFGREGTAPGEFWLPAGMFIDPKGWVWVADSYNRRVQVFRPFDEPGAGDDENEVQP